MKVKWFASRLLAAGTVVIILAFTTVSEQKDDGKGKQTAFKADSPAGCRFASWEPEVFSLYGDTAAVRRKLNNFEMNLPNRRVFVFMIETADSAQVSLFERATDADGSAFHLWTWKGQSARDLREKATETILANRGVLCVGEQIKALVKALNPNNKGDIPAPATALAAFGHVIKEYEKDYVRLTVFLLC